MEREKLKIYFRQLIQKTDLLDAVDKKNLQIQIDTLSDEELKRVYISVFQSMKEEKKIEEDYREKAKNLLNEYEILVADFSQKTVKKLRKEDETESKKEDEIILKSLLKELNNL